VNICGENVNMKVSAVIHSP